MARLESFPGMKVETSNHTTLGCWASCLAHDAVRPWTDMRVRSFGDDEDPSGFSSLGACQDARPEKEDAIPRAVGILFETWAPAVHYTYMREYWVQGRKPPLLQAR